MEKTIDPSAGTVVGVIDAISGSVSGTGRLPAAILAATWLPMTPPHGPPSIDEPIVQSSPMSE